MTPTTELLRRLVLPALALGAFGVGLNSDQGAPVKVDFTHDVGPIFSAHCAKCHGGTETSGGLSLNTAASILKGGDSGPAATPGQSGKSLLLERILGKGGLAQMPMGFKPLSDKDIAIVKDWIDQGCVDVAVGKKSHWTYTAPVRPKLPAVKDGKWVRNPIDALVLAGIEKEYLAPAPEADRITLIRRVTLDLIGLPPTPAEVDAFVNDKSPQAYEKVVDRLFTNPHYGERMALPWLDAARYADSNGFQQDGDTYQFVWRDWVIQAMNANMPFDKFTVDQLAGDLLPKPTRDELIATGFNRNHMLNGEGGAIAEEQRNVILFDRVDTTSTTWLGLTMACARCHDHKYDPLSQADYYSMMAFFNNVPESGVPSGGGQYRIADPWIYAGSPEQTARMSLLETELPVAREKAKPYEEGPDADKAQLAWEAKATGLPKEFDDVLKTPVDKRSKDAAARLHGYYLDHGLQSPVKELRAAWQAMDNELRTLRDTTPRVMVMSDSQPRVTHRYDRGNYESPKEVVKPRTPTAFAPMVGESPPNRLGLAKWMVSPRNPLMARVQVNRYWQLFFGQGLVKTPENFGVQGEPPANPELLDWLAVEFRESGWNVKRLQKLIVMSNTYRQSSRVSRALREKDPENRFLARGARFRLPSMLLRDEALAASGLLQSKMFGKPVYPYQPKGIWDGLAITEERDFTYPQSKGDDNHRRSIYTFWRRTVAPGNMFDASARNVCTVRASQTSTPLHALTMLNDVTWVEAGRALAARVLVLPSAEARLAGAFRLVCSRTPAPDELKVLTRGLNRALTAYRKDPAAAKAFLAQGDALVDPKADVVQLAAYATTCQAILNLDEAMTRE